MTFLHPSPHCQPMKLLFNHTSPETAYVVNDYPYGCRLRCKIRYWLEYSKSKGIRFCSQTTNPKVNGEVWNKPKKSNYSIWGGAMYLDDNNHVEWSGFHEYMDLMKMINWYNTYQQANHPDIQATTRKIIRLKLAHDKQKSDGKLFWKVNGVVEKEPIAPELDWASEETAKLIQQFN